MRWFHPLTLIVCVLEWKCRVSRAKGVFHPDVYSCVVEGCPLETKERLSTMTSLVHVDNVTQWLYPPRVLSYS